MTSFFQSGNHPYCILLQQQVKCADANVESSIAKTVDAHQVQENSNIANEDRLDSSTNGALPHNDKGKENCEPKTTRSGRQTKPRTSLIKTMGSEVPRLVSKTVTPVTPTPRGNGNACLDTHNLDLPEEEKIDLAEYATDSRKAMELSLLIKI